MDFFKKTNENCKNLSDRKWSYEILFVLLLILEFLRRTDALLNPQLYAEDGRIFLQEAIYHSVGSLFIPFAGYFHTIPRLVALISLEFGLKNAPLIMNLSALFISVFCSSYIFKSQFRFIIRHDLHRFLLSILIICIPVPEIFLNITNIQWFLILFLTLWCTKILFSPEIFQAGFFTFAEILFVVLSILSCPLSIILIPGLLVGLIFEIRTRQVKVKFGLITISLITIFCYFVACLSVNKSEIASIPSPIILGNMVISEMVGRLFYYNIHSYLGYYFAVLAACIVIELLSYSIIRRHEYHIDCWIVLLFLLNICVLTLLRPSFIVNFSKVLWVIGWERYLFFPFVLVLILVIRHAGTFNRSNLKYLFLGILCIISINFALNYEIRPFSDYHYQSSIAGFDPNGTENYTIAIPPNPEWGWYLQLPTNSFFLENSSKNDKFKFQKSINKMIYYP